MLYSLQRDLRLSPFSLFVHCFEQETKKTQSAHQRTSVLLHFCSFSHLEVDVHSSANTEAVESNTLRENRNVNLKDAGVKR